MHFFRYSESIQKNRISFSLRLPVSQIGDRTTLTTGSVQFNLRYVASGSFYVGANPPAANNVTLTKGYWIGETEVTYKLWYDVKTWVTGSGVGIHIVKNIKSNTMPSPAAASASA
jgi:hypothetical protein